MKYIFISLNRLKQNEYIVHTYPFKPCKNAKVKKKKKYLSTENSTVQYIIQSVNYFCLTLAPPGNTILTCCTSATTRTVQD